MGILDGPLTAGPPDAYRPLRTDTMQRMTLRLTRSDREAARRAPGSNARPGPLEAAADVLAQYGWALAAGPLQVAALGMSAVRLTGPAVALQSRVLREPTQPVLRGNLTVLARTAAALPVALVSSAAALLLLMVLGRGALYPLWAAQASHADLARSWGGPSPVGATAVHVLGAMGVGLAGLVLLRTLRAAHAWLLLHPAPGRPEG